MRGRPDQVKPTLSRLLAPLLGVTVLAAVSLIVGVSPASAAPGQTTNGELWTRRYNGTANDADVAYAIGVSPDGGTVYVTGTSIGINETATDIVTAAYDAETGGKRWTQRYDGIHNEDVPSSIAVSPDGATVYVTGSSIRYSYTSADYITMAIDAATGTRRWVQHYDGGGEWDAATIAYDAERGKQLWVSRYRGGDLSGGTSLAVSPDGTRVYVTGTSNGGSGGWGDQDYATISYDAGSGAELWVTRYNFAQGTDSPTKVAVSPDGAMVFVTGESRAPTRSSPDVATVAYDAQTGVQAWVRRYAGPGTRYDRGNALAVSPDGSLLFVAGFSELVPNHDDYVTVAYDTSTGEQGWVRLYDGPATNVDMANAVAVSPDGSTVYVTGSSMGSDRQDDYATLAYDALTGAKRWLRRYNGPARGSDSAWALALAPDGSRVYVTGGSDGATSGQDFATLAYSP